MATKIQLPEDFKEFLRLLKANKVEYLLVGGYAVGFYGCPRPTGDVELFTLEKSIIRMGVAPFKLEIITHIDGVEFAKCFAEKNVAQIDGVEVNLISLTNLKINKKASGRLKDLNDLENLP